MDRAEWLKLSESIFKEAYAEVRNTIPADQWVKMTQAEKEEACTFAVEEQLAQKRVKERLAVYRKAIN